MSDPVVETKIEGGSQTGFVGVGSVSANSIVINNYSGALQEPVAVSEDVGPCPYPGLAYFGPNDARRFFGRNKTIGNLIAAVGRQSLTALVGASGSGKSSVVLAGLAPSLYKKGGWLFSYFRIGSEPDRDPFLALAAALVPFYAPDADATDRLVQAGKLANALNSGELTLRHVFAACRGQNKGSHILLIADQFEEAFTLVTDDDVRQRFIEVLLADFPYSLSGDSPDICLILTLRADYFGEALSHRLLTDALQGHVENLGPMNREEMREAIALPAENAKVSFEPGLVETLLDEVEGKPGSLPLLQFALREMWGRQDKRNIARKSYDAIGGVQGALARRAEKIYAELTADGANKQRAKDFQRLFTRLVAPGEGAGDTRRIADRSELGDDVWKLAQRLADENNRLVVTCGAEALHTYPVAESAPNETVELIHEAMIRHWPRLITWIGQDRFFQTWLARIKPNVSSWSTNQSDDGLLLRGGMLVQATDWMSGRSADLSKFERDYIDASIALDQRSRRRTQVRQSLIAGWAVTFFFIALTMFHLWSRVSVEKQRVEVALALAHARSAMQSQRYPAAIDAASWAFDHDPSSSSRTTLLAALSQLSPYLAGRVNSSNTSPNAIIWSTAADLEYAMSNGRLMLAHVSLVGRRRVEDYFDPKGNTQKADPVAVLALRTVGPGNVVAAMSDGTINAVNLKTHGMMTLQSNTHINAYAHSSTSISGDGNLIAIALPDEGPVLYNCAQKLVPTGHTCSAQRLLATPVTAVEISPSGDYSALGDDSGDIKIKRISDGEIMTPFSTGFAVRSLAWNAKRNVLAIAGAEGQVKLFDLISHSAFSLPTSSGVVSAMAWNPSGNLLAYECDEYIVCVAGFGDAGALAATPAILRLVGHTARVTRLAWAPDGNHLASADAQEILIWQLRPDRRIISTLRSPVGSPAIAIAPDVKHHRLAIAYQDGDTDVWDTNALLPASPDLGAQTRRTVRGPSESAKAVAWSSRSALAIAYVSGKIAIWGEHLTDGYQLRTTPWDAADLSFMPDGSRLVIRSENGEVHVLAARDRDDPRPEIDLAEVGPASALAVDPVSGLVILSEQGGWFSIWDPLQKQPNTRFKGVDLVSALGLDVSPDGRLLAGGGGDKSIKLFDLASDKSVQRLPLEFDGATQETAGAVAFSPSGEFLAALGADGRTYVWESHNKTFEMFLAIEPTILQPFANPKGLKGYQKRLAWMGNQTLAILTTQGAVEIVGFDTQEWKRRLISLSFAPDDFTGGMADDVPP